MKPDRVVIGVESERARDVMSTIYRPLNLIQTPMVFTNIETAEVTKYAGNAFLATKISFINMLAELAEKSGADVRSIAHGMGLDGRIGPRFLHAGIGYGGSCFPKDIKALLVTAKDYGVDMPIVSATDKVNQHARQRFIQKILKRVPKKSAIAVWGLSFKPKTDDMRDAPSLDIIPALMEAGHSVRVYDPVAMEHSKKLLPATVQFTKNVKATLPGAAALVILTEWDEFRGVDLATIRKTMDGNLLFDGRNIYEPEEVRAAGLQYFGMGVQ